MIPLGHDEKIVKAFEVKSSNHGKGIFYITTCGVFFESQKYGPVLDVSFEWLRSHNAPTKDKFKLVWDTPAGQRLGYVLKIIPSEQAVNAYAVANQEYANSLSEIESLKAKFCASARKPA